MYQDDDLAAASSAISDIVIPLAAVGPNGQHVQYKMKMMTTTMMPTMPNDEDKSKCRLAYLDWQPCPWWRFFPF